MSSKRWFVAVAACAAQAVLGTACTDVGVVPEVPEEGEGMAALDGPQASWAGGLFPDPENDPRCEPVGSEGGVDEYRCETRTTPLTRNDDDVWYICRYRVQIYNNGDQIVITVDLLRCWIVDPDEGGEEEASLTLDCPGTPLRGSTAQCVASVEGGNVDASEVVFEWKSGYATWTDSSGTGGSTWEGVVTDDTEITVTVSGDEIADTSTATITVGDRTVGDPMWPFPQVNASWQFSSQIGDLLGLYIVPPTPSTVPPASVGTGPWKGRFYMASPPQASTSLLVHWDYSASGPAYPGARGTCQPAPASLAAVASYYEVMR